MTTEDDFQKQLDEHPDDHHTRLVFADWLDERGDPRGPGYRALGSLRLAPHLYGWRWYWGNYPQLGKCRWSEEFCGAMIPCSDWHNQIQPRFSQVPEFWVTSDTRREAEDAAALTFAQLPPERQAELLNLQEAAQC